MRDSLDTICVKEIAERRRKRYRTRSRPNANDECAYGNSVWDDDGQRPRRACLEDKHLQDLSSLGTTSVCYYHRVEKDADHQRIEGTSRSLARPVATRCMRVSARRRPFLVVVDWSIMSKAMHMLGEVESVNRSVNSVALPISS